MVNNMKTIILVLFLFFGNILSDIIFCQNELKEPILYLYADDLPHFANKMNLHDYIYNNIQWPAQFDGEGTVLISFVIQKDGKIKNINIERGLCPVCDDEVKRVFELMPTWEPGVLNSEKVDIKMYFPVVFKIK